MGGGQRPAEDSQGFLNLSLVDDEGRLLWWVLALFAVGTVGLGAWPDLRQRARTASNSSSGPEAA